MTLARELVVASTAPFPPHVVERWIPPEVAARVVVVEPRTRASLLAAVADADVVVGDYAFELELDADAISAMRRCRLIQQPSVGYQHIDVAVAADRGVPVANTAGANDVPVAEHTVMSAAALLRQLVDSDAATRRGEWPQLSMRRSEIGGRTWGIVGAGMIGQNVARRLQGWSVRLVYQDVRRLDHALESELGLTYLGLDELLAEVDILSLHVPLTTTTRHLIDHDALAKMKPTAIIVNVARGAVVDEHALAHALREQRLAGASLDVFEHEPLPADDPLTGLDSVLLTPHVAGATLEAQIRIVKLTGTNVTRALRGEWPENVVNGVRPAGA